MRWRAWSASICSPLRRPPTRSPAENDDVIASAASAQVRSSSGVGGTSAGDDLEGARLRVDGDQHRVARPRRRARRAARRADVAPVLERARRRAGSVSPRRGLAAVPSARELGALVGAQPVTSGHSCPRSLAAASVPLARRAAPDGRGPGSGVARSRRRADQRAGRRSRRRPRSVRPGPGPARGRDEQPDQRRRTPAGCRRRSAAPAPRHRARRGRRRRRREVAAGRHGAVATASSSGDGTSRTTAAAATGGIATVVAMPGSYAPPGRAAAARRTADRSPAIGSADAAGAASARRPAGRRAARGRPSASVSGTRQLGYSWSVPGWFCARRSPTASASETASSRDGRPREVAVQRLDDLLLAGARRAAGPRSVQRVDPRGEVGLVGRELLVVRRGQQAELVAQPDVLARDEARRRRQVVGGHARQRELAPLLGRQRDAVVVGLLEPQDRGAEDAALRAGRPAPRPRPCRGPRR